MASYVGNGAAGADAARLGRRTRAKPRCSARLEFFLGYYRDHMLDNTRLYPSVKEGLDRMRESGARMAVLTNKPVRFSRAIVEGLGLGGHFFQIYGGNSFEQKKPDPIGIEKLLEESGICARARHHGGRQRRGHPHGAQREGKSLRGVVRVPAGEF